MTRAGQHPQGQCPNPIRYRRIGDRSLYSLCDACKAIYSGPPFMFTFVPATSPEWVIRQAEGRLPAKIRYAA